jgi:hypothetical protein
VSWVVNSFTVCGEGFEDLVGGLGPGERPGVLVPCADFGFELSVVDAGLQDGQGSSGKPWCSELGQSKYHKILLLFWWIFI